MTRPRKDGIGGTFISWIIDGKVPVKGQGLRLWLKNVSSKEQHQLGQEKIHNQDEHGRGHHRMRGRATHTLRSALYV
jgi:hypothetical protein